MQFLALQPIYIIGLILTIGFMLFMGYKIILELKLNHQLSLKQKQLRIKKTNIRLKKRLTIMTSTAFAPLLILVLLMSFTIASPKAIIGDTYAIQSSSDILNIYKEFNEKNESSYFNDLVNSPEENIDTSDGSSDYSETNVQVRGVDEMDNVLTDGLYIYQALNNQIYITLAYTESNQANALSNYKTISFIQEEDSCQLGMYISGLYVDDEYLIVIGSEYNSCNTTGYNDYDIIEPWLQDSQQVTVKVYDKQNQFQLIDTYQLSGNLIGTRKIDSQLYVITNRWLPFIEENPDFASYLPNFSINDTQTKITYNDILYINGTNPNSFTTFFSINLDNQTIDTEVFLGDSGYNLYVSHQSIYLVGTIYDYNQISEIIDVNDYIKTAILKINISDNQLNYEASQQIPGYTLNQFSMDEYNNHLRIATTSGWWGEEINNRIIILDDNLNEVSRLENLGKPGETIKSVRFMNEYAYLVTFEQTDPFYVINIENPQQPVVEGELEIPGFSTYLQPINNDYILGIGFGDSNGGTNGLKISIYDISDKTNPQIFDETIFDYSEFGWAWSSATYNHKDLLFDLNKGILALPFTTYNWNSEEGYQYNSGVLVYHFDDIQGLSKSGFITHENNSDENVYVYKIKFIDDYFYSISNKYIKASLISDPETIIQSVTLPTN